jgi:hypothetical protein
VQNPSYYHLEDSTPEGVQAFLQVTIMLLQCHVMLIKQQYTAIDSPYAAKHSSSTTHLMTILVVQY